MFHSFCVSISCHYLDIVGSRHGVCSGLSQLDYFSKALELAKQYRTQLKCTSDYTCGVCFSQDLESELQCSSEAYNPNLAIHSMNHNFAPLSLMSTGTVVSSRGGLRGGGGSSAPEDVEYSIA